MFETQRGCQPMNCGEPVSAIFLTEGMKEREVVKALRDIREAFKARYPAPPPEEPKKGKGD